MNKKDRKQRFSLTVLFSAIVFVILVGAITISALAVYFLAKIGVIGGAQGAPTFGTTLFFTGLISILMGTSIALLAGKLPLKPVNKWINNMNRLAAGDFKVRMKFRKPLNNHPVAVELSDSFNKLAEELQNTEILRSDFINNFSHEFKTPIVSIAGFAKLLKRGNLSEEQRIQYLTAIEEESMRLSYMATNVLNLTKVENQTILTDVSEYNLSEQVRAAVLLLEEKWSKKNIDLQLDFDEHMIEANEELLKQVWINLIDNAVKFVPRCGTVALEIQDTGEHLKFTISNTGSEIPPDKQEKIFNKFYQADESHATKGNGIGLAIVKRITELHRGKVSVQSGNGMTTFTVVLPKAQQ